jgi:hypothetical protein
VSKLIFLAATVALVVIPALHAQPRNYQIRDTVRLVSTDPSNPLPDSRVVAVSGDRIHVTTVAVIVNGEAVKDVPADLLAGFSQTVDQVIPTGHYFVIGEKRLGPNSIVEYNGIIPNAQILGKVTKP